MKIRTNIKAGIGGGGNNHNEKMAGDKKSLKVKTGIKAGDTALSPNHNEKLTSDNNRSFEQKKTIAKKLRLSKETIRELRDMDLKVIAGGQPPAFTGGPRSYCNRCDG